MLAFLEMKNMTNPSKSILVFGVLVFLALLMDSRLILAQEVGPDNENEFSYIKGSEKGPEHWGELQKEWAACGNGKMQSPINLSNEIVQIKSDLGKLKTSYKPFDATLKNEGHVIMLQWNGDAGFLEIYGTKYFLKQIHWHHPSEHVINGLRFDLEAHLVHASANNGTAVLAVMHKFGQPDSLLSELEGQIRSLSDNKTEANVGAIDPSHVKIGGWKYYRYSGSLTTPPCTEGVIWTINEQIMTVSIEQVTTLRTAVDNNSKENSRPLQAINNREIYLYSPKYKRSNQLLSGSGFATSPLTD